MMIMNYCRNQLCICSKNAVFRLKSTGIYYTFKNTPNGAMLHTVFSVSQNVAVSGK